ncbi:MAG: hypothetical protein ACJ761_08885 [Chloroflexota bacterium]
MERRSARFVVLVLGPLLLIVGALAMAGRSAPSGSLAPDVAQLDGVVVGVESQGLDRVGAFTLRAADGRTIRFRIGVLENGAQFPPGHLAEHQATAQKVRVTYRTEGSDLVAYRLEDAP